MAEAVLSQSVDAEIDRIIAADGEYIKEYYNTGEARVSLLLALREVRTDSEEQHSRAESLLVAFLREACDDELADAWLEAQNRQSWWYA